MTPEEIKQEFQLDYGINNLQFDPRGNPIFWFEDSLTIINTLAPDFAPHFTDKKFSEAIKLASVCCGSEKVPNKYVGVCFVGSPLGINKFVEDEHKAGLVAASRALSRYFKAINFDCLQAHLDARINKPFTPKIESDQAQIARLRKAIHALKNDLDLDDVTYRYYLADATKTATAEGVSSTTKMTIEQMNLSHVYLQGIRTGIQAERLKVMA
jgi:hypothetical protein